MGNALEVIETGPLATVQDLGRSGYADMGVGTSGAADRGSFRLANRLVGNQEAAAAVEVTFGGLVVRARHDVTVAVTGASCPVTVDDRVEAINSLLRLRAGAVLRLGPPVRGLRSYLAVRGGIDVRPVLGSRATDLLSGLGPECLRPGVLLPIETPTGPLPAIGFAPVANLPEDDLILTVVPGPRDDWFERSALVTLLSEPYTVTPESNRIGIRLDGPALIRTNDAELPSEGMVAGALQVPPSGRLTLFLADHPVTGGYPVVAVVVATDVDKAAQARPGMRIRFSGTRN
ncbi:biotin-dependent carboxyltransferase family protein [Amycolatopsis palatopharyngis]|uniref:5-oxoprolinase subunit C family protein n=1 Tax=Amycolatopsis palatopharyngis TaxID=187982 RepID=UPI000E23AE8A|nr:biotin-dependent carboxyltransferase family protein [Amycolatopsis palatopharyngis]